MRASVITDSVGAFLLASAIVWHFSPAPGSFWGNTFFGLPYAIATIIVPLAAAASAGTACWVTRRKSSLARRGVIARGVAIGVIAFALYGLFHVIANVVVELLGGVGLQLALMGIVGLGLAIAFFGGVFIMPICCIVAVGCEWLAGKIAA
jgi:hypothetical protein